MIPPELCTFLTFPGEFIPYSWLVAIAAATVWIGNLILSSLPISAQAAPLLGAAIAGFEIHKHKGLTVLTLYVVVSAAIVAEKIPVCQPM
jgi:hypothetical protein